MKKFTKGLFVFAALALLTGFCFAFRSDSDGGFIKVYLKNKCSSDVEVYVTQSGGGTKYTVEDGTEKPFSFQEGQKIYDKDQRTLIHEVKSGDEGKTIIVCD